MRSRVNNFGLKPNDFVSESGSGKREIFHGKLDPKTGIIELISDGFKDVYAEIQSYADSCDINRIVDRYMNGDIDILNQVQGVYGDFSSSPKTLAEVLSLGMEMEQKFNSLPPKIKEQFGNNYITWLSSAGSDDWLRVMSPAEEKKDVVDQKEGVDE